MNISVSQVNDAIIIGIKGELDHHTAPDVRNAIEAELDKGSANKVILDCTNLTFMDSSGLGVILGRYKRLKAQDGTLVACSLTPQVNRIFELSGLKRIIDIYKNVNTALDNV